MSVSSAWRTVILAILVFVGVTGCDYLERNSKVSEETEAHFIDGVTSKKLQDFDGAILHFENALKANPSSGAAHRELALLYDYYKNRHLRALYHYERFSELRTNEVNQLIRDRVYHCRVMVARDNFETLERTQVRTEVENLRKQLRDALDLIESMKRELAASRGFSNQVVVLQQQLTQTQAQLAQAQAQAQIQGQAPAPQPNTYSDPGAGSSPTGDRNPAQPVGVGRSMADTTGGRTAPAQPRTGTATQPSQPRASKPSAEAGVTPKRTHTVQAGETMSLIARRYGVKVPALQAANPKVDARHMRAGTPLVIPDR